MSQPWFYFPPVRYTQLSVLTDSAPGLSDVFMFIQTLYVTNCYTTLQHLPMTNIYLNSHKTLDS